MLTLGNLTLFLLLVALGAWFWHGHGIRERALLAVRRHCEKQSLELLDGHVAFQRFGFCPDAQGQRRLSRIFAFEFTVNGRQRHPGRIVMFGPRVGHIELAPYPLAIQAAADPEPVRETAPAPRAQVVDLAAWRRRRDQSER